MNPIKRIIMLAIVASLSSGWMAHAEEPATTKPAAAETTNAPALAATPKDAPATNAAPDSALSASTPANDQQAAEATINAPLPTLAVVSETDKGLRFNFRGAPLEMVLNYLSDAAGFIIVLETEAKGKVDLFSNQPLNKEEAVSLLNRVLEKNGLAAIRSDRTLTIVSRDEARKRDVPVKSGSEPNDIPKTDDIVTQILPVHSLNAVQLAKDLQPLVSTDGLSANEAGNALVMTDTQTHIRRVAEIIRALDTSLVSTIRVFPLKFADAKSLAAVLKEVFQNEGGGSSRSDLRSMFYSRWRGGEEGSDRESSRSERGSRSSGGGGAGSSRVVAVADDHSNSLVISAPDDLMNTIEDLIKSVDTNVEDVTEVRVFHLKYADPTEMSELLSSLFSDDAKSDENSRSMGVRFGGFPFGGFPGSSSSSSSSSRSSRGESAGDQSDRMKRKTRVTAVADKRTSSVVVSAAKDLMVQIAGMVQQLDSNPARKQKVFVYTLENADVQDVEQVLQDLFASESSRNNRSTQNQNNNPLSTRNNTSNQTGSGAASAFGQGGFGGQTQR